MDRLTESGSARRVVEAVWRMESARIVATLTRRVGDFAFAEDLAQEALVEALRKWPEEGVPPNPGAWLTTVAARKTIDAWRRRERLDERHAAIAADLASRVDPDALPWDPDAIDDDVLRLVFIACHPVLSREARAALTLRTVAGLTTEQIARAFLVPVATIQQRIVRAKRTLAEAKVPFELPSRDEYPDRLGSVLGVLYVLFNEGYVPASGDDWVRPDVALEALRVGRVLAGLVPDEPEVHGLVALMEFQSSRFAARTRADGASVPLDEQDRTRWDRDAIRRGRAALGRADAIGRGRGAFALQAGIAEAHAIAPTFGDTDWERIVVLYEALGRLAPSPVVDLNHAAAVSYATGPANALRMVDALVAGGKLDRYAPLYAVRGELLARLGRTAEARADLERAASLTANEPQRRALLAKAARYAS